MVVAVSYFIHLLQSGKTYHRIHVNEVGSYKLRFWAILRIIKSRGLDTKKLQPQPGKILRYLMLGQVLKPENPKQKEKPVCLGVCEGDPREPFKCLETQLDTCRYRWTCLNNSRRLQTPRGMSGHPYNPLGTTRYLWTPPDTSGQLYSWLPITRTLANSSLALSRSNFHFPSGHFLYNFTRDNSKFR